jgi:hypothetical protein
LAEESDQKAQRPQKISRDLVLHGLVALETAVEPAVSNHLLAVHWINPLHTRNRPTIRPVSLPNLRWGCFYPSAGYVLLTASGVPDDQVARHGALRHLPVSYRTTGLNPGCQFVNVLRVLIYLQHVDLDPGHTSYGDASPVRVLVANSC